MQNLARDMVSTLRSGDVLLLYGELGSGKTTFVQGLARALGIADHVTSPTFTIVGEYSVGDQAAPQGEPRSAEREGVDTLVHVDLYRLEEKTAAQDPAVRDVLDRAGDPGRLTVIEWADRLGEEIPKTSQRIGFKHGEMSEERSLTFY